MKVISVVVLIILTAFLNYKREISDVLSYYLTPSQIISALAAIKLIVISGIVAWGVYLLVEPVRRLAVNLPNVPQKKLLEELEQAQGYSGEILRRLMRALPFEQILLKIAGVDRKHLHTYEDKVKYKTIAAIMLMIAVYIAVAIHYLISMGKEPLFDLRGAGGAGLAGAQGFLAHINNVISQHSFVIAIIFAFFILAIDRLIVSDHSIEYRLLKVRLQVWGGKFRDQYATKDGRKTEQRDIPRENTPWWEGRYLNWYWRRGPALPLPLAASNSTEWARDAAALFHPRSFFSTILIIGIRLVFAVFTSVLVSNAFLLKIYSKDIESEVLKLSAKFESDASNCADFSQPSLACRARRAESNLAAIRERVEQLTDVINAEHLSEPRRRVFCVFVATNKSTGATLAERASEFEVPGTSPEALCDQLKGKRFNSNGNYESEVKWILTTTGNQSKKQNQGPHVSSLNWTLNAAKSQLAAAETDEINQKKVVTEAIEKYKQGISVRLAALQNLRDKPDSGADLGTSFKTLELALRVLLMGFELIPVLLTKVTPMLGWMPSMYVWSICRERIELERSQGALLTRSPYPEAMNIAAPSSSAAKLPVDPHKDMDPADLVVGLLTALRLPIVVLAAILFGLFSIARPLFEFLGLAPS